MHYNTFMKHFLCVSVWCLLGILGLTPNVNAQATPAWTRHLTPTQWKELAHGVILPRAKGQATFMDLSRRISTIPQVKTTDKNWIRHKIFYSGLFSHQEKEILLTHSYPHATLGKTIYLYDKHAAFYNQLARPANRAHISQQAFEQHQQILQELTHTLQLYYVQQIPMLFTSAPFSSMEILRLLQTSQPAAYVLTPQELNDFASIPSLSGQQSWSADKLKTTTLELEPLLFRPTETLTPADFAQYYVLQSRRSYFKLLCDTLAHANQKRASAIVRFRLPLQEGDEKLTDAQRGGKLLFDAKGDDSVLKEFAPNYGVYAAAEALNTRYEIALQFGANAPELLGWAEGQRLRNLSPQDCLDELSPKIDQLRASLAHMSAQVPTDNSFYVTYYSLYAQLQIYETLVARAQVMVNFNR